MSSKDTIEEVGTAENDTVVTVVEVDGDKTPDKSDTFFKEEDRKKPRGWTDAEFAEVNEGWEGSLDVLIDLVRRAGPVVKTKKMWGGPTQFVFFENIILEIANDPRKGGILVDTIVRKKKIDKNGDHIPIGCSVLFTHASENVRCSMAPDECCSWEGKQIYLCTAFSVLESPAFESDDMAEYQAQLDIFGEKFKKLALPEPVALNFLY